MIYRVVGCHKETGEGVDMLLHAPSVEWVQRIAQQRGLIVDSIDPVEPPPPVEAEPRLSRLPPPARPDPPPASPDPPGTALSARGIEE